MKQLLKVLVATALAVLSGWTVLFAAPVRIASITDAHLKQPTLIAQDTQGNLYVTETSLNIVRIFDRQGVYQRSFVVARPLGIAVDRSGLIYVCSETKRRIEVYNPNLSFSHVLDATEGNVRSPAIAIDGDGNLYVVDNFVSRDGLIRQDTVRVYDPAGTPLFHIGSTGSVDGLLFAPGGIAVSDARGEVYIADRPIMQTKDGPISGARIQVFDKKGTWLRTLPVQYGGSAGQITSPMAMAADGNGTLYVVDSFQRAVLMFHLQTGAFSGALHDAVVPLQIPLGVTVGADKIARVTSYGGASIEVYALDGYITMDTAPASLAFTGYHYSSSRPEEKTVTITNTGSGTLHWTAAKDQKWIALGGRPADTPSVTGSTAAENSNGLAVGVDLSEAAYESGTYSGTVTITSDYGQTNRIPVTLTVTPPPVLSLSTGWLDFTAKKGKNPPSQPVVIATQNALSIPWSTAIDAGAPWLRISPASGVTTTGAMMTASVSVDTTGLPVGGPYSGSISFLSSGALWSGSKLTVNLTILPSTRIAVTTNRPEATFTLAGPAAYSGANTSWSVDDAPSGAYTITFNPVPGYERPSSATKTLPTEGEIIFAGNYTSVQEDSLKKKIITAKGPWISNDALLRIFRSDGSPEPPDLMALDSSYGANIASGDIDGDGSAELIVGAGMGRGNSTLVRVLKADTNLLTQFVAFPGMYGGVTVAQADFDGDGKAEIVVASAGQSKNSNTVKVYAYDAGTGAMAPTGIEIRGHSTMNGIAVAAAGIGEHQEPLMITAPVLGTARDYGAVKIWKIDTSGGRGKWSAAMLKSMPLTNRYGAAVAAGDMDGDGRVELVLGVIAEGRTRSARGSVKTTQSLVRIVRTDGTEVGRIPVSDEIYAMSVAAGDLDGDGNAEILVGLGSAPGGGRESAATEDREKQKRRRDRIAGKETGNEDVSDQQAQSTVQVYEASGKHLFTLTPYEDSPYGVNVTVSDPGFSR